MHTHLDLSQYKNGKITVSRGKNQLMFPHDQTMLIQIIGKDMAIG